MAEAGTVAAAARALEVAATTADLGADLRAICLFAAVAAVTAAVVAADLVMRAACRVVVQADAWATSVSVAIGIARAATLRLVTAACAAETAAADGIVPVAALPVALQTDAFSQGRLSGRWRGEGWAGVSAPGGLGVVEDGCASDQATKAEQGFQ